MKSILSKYVTVLFISATPSRQADISGFSPKDRRPHIIPKVTYHEKLLVSLKIELFVVLPTNEQRVWK